MLSLLTGEPARGFATRLGVIFQVTCDPAGFRRFVSVNINVIVALLQDFFPRNSGSA
jgi:hypothetical protein